MHFALSAVCSSASVERSFSSQAFVHTQLRNRLHESRVEKLLHVYFNEKNLDEEEIAFHAAITARFESNDDTYQEDY